MLIDRIKALYYEQIVQLVKRYHYDNYLLGKKVKEFILNREQAQLKRKNRRY